jgi:uncharacterized protein (DUF488 family)
VSAPGIVWTIGHSNLSGPAFLALLAGQDIEVLADVRRFPGSRRHPQFSQESLRASLAEGSMEYLHFPELGGRRKALAHSRNTAWRHEAFRGYADYMETVEFERGVERLEGTAREHRTAIMCAEALWWQCHRGLVSDYLKVRGWRVMHISSAGKVEEHPYTSAAKVRDGKLSYEGETLELPL